MKLICKLLITMVLIGFFSTVFAGDKSDEDELGPWSALFYAGATGKESYGDVLIGRFSRFGENVYALELAYTLDKENWFRRIFKPVFDTVELAGNVAYRHDYNEHDGVKEVNLYVVWRFTRFPWSKYLRNSIAIGDGIAYDSHVAYANRRPREASENEFSRLLNFLLLEVTFAAPQYPRLQLALRVHHNCAAWGFFPKNSSARSTTVGVGVRWYF